MATVKWRTMGNNKRSRPRRLLLLNSRSSLQRRGRRWRRSSGMVYSRILLKVHPLFLLQTRLVSTLHVHFSITFITLHSSKGVKLFKSYRTRTNQTVVILQTSFRYDVTRFKSNKKPKPVKKSTPTFKDENVSLSTKGWVIQSAYARIRSKYSRYVALLANWQRTHCGHIAVYHLPFAWQPMNCRIWQLSGMTRGSPAPLLFTCNSFINTRTWLGMKFS